jgi:FkbM family methyltransferase
MFLGDYFAGRTGLYIDVGGGHPIRLSNTYWLYGMGWMGVVVEPIRAMVAKHRRFRPRDIQVNAAVGDTDGEVVFRELIPSVLSTCDESEAIKVLSSGSARLYREYSVPVLTVAGLYRTHLAPQPVSLLSVDTEGRDLAVLRGVDWDVLSPEVVLCEANDAVKGCEIRQYLSDRGYGVVKELGCNVVFTLRPS